mgnify:CR=1 FL=1
MLESLFGPELGTLALSAACVVALAQAALPMIGAQRGRQRTTDQSTRAGDGDACCHAEHSQEGDM